MSRSALDSGVSPTKSKFVIPYKELVFVDLPTQRPYSEAQQDALQDLLMREAFITWLICHSFLHSLRNFAGYLAAPMLLARQLLFTS